MLYNISIGVVCPNNSAQFNKCARQGCAKYYNNSTAVILSLYTVPQPPFVQRVEFPYLLSDGAALFYTSVKEDKNCDLLHKYLVHRIYGFPFDMPAFVVERDAVFM